MAKPQTWDKTLDFSGRQWEYPTMTATTDAKKRVVISQAHPGDVFDVRKQGEGRFLLVRLEKPKPLSRRSRSACLKAIAGNPLRLRMPWEELRRLTREP